MILRPPPTFGLPQIPGLAKVRRAPVATRRTLELVGLREGWFSTLVEAADVVSEGAVQQVGPGFGYFGSTSLRCGLSAYLNRAGNLLGERRAALSGNPQTSVTLLADQLATLVVSDPLAKLRLLRLAHREATSRAGQSLGVLSAEISTTIHRASASPNAFGSGPDRGAILAIDIDVSAELIDCVAQSAE